ncbi:MAG: HAD-IIIA family hydrolase [Dehalococcoidales bacterium]
MSKYKAVIFDMDGTLLNTLEDITDSVNFALRKNGFPLHKISQIRNYVGNGVLRMIELAIPDGTPQALFDGTVDLFKQHYAANSKNKTCPYAGIIELLQELLTQNYQTAVISNKYDLAVKELNQFYFSNYIKLAIGESPQIKRKPAADMLLFALDRLNIKPSEALYVGDSEVDIETAKNAGTDFIAVSWGFRGGNFLRSHGASIIIDTPSELLSFL